jgi:urease accessory protein UreF
MFNNNTSIRVRMVSAISAIALVVTAFSLNFTATQAQDNPTPTPAPTSAATQAATVSADGLSELLGGTKFPGIKRIGLDIRKALVDAVTQTTHLTEAQIIQAMTTGKSLNDVISANNADPKAVQATVNATLTGQINAAVTAGTLKQAAADKLIAGLDPLLNRIFTYTVPSASDRITRLVKGVELRELLAETATESKLTAQVVVKALTAGQTLAQIAQANNADPAAIVTAVTQKVTDQINKQVKAGKLTQAQADTLLTNLNGTLTGLMNQTNPLLPGNGRSGGKKAAPTSTPAGSSS